MSPLTLTRRRENAQYAVQRSVHAYFLFAILNQQYTTWDELGQDKESFGDNVVFPRE